MLESCNNPQPEPLPREGRAVAQGCKGYVAYADRAAGRLIACYHQPYRVGVATLHAPLDSVYCRKCSCAEGSVNRFAASPNMSSAPEETGIAGWS